MKILENSSSIIDLISGAMDKLKTIVDSSTIVGESIVTQVGDTIIPISKVTVGFVVGGGEYADLSSRRVANHFPMSGGSSGGMSVSPVGFLVITSDGDVNFVNVENKTLEQTMINLFNTILSKIEKKNKQNQSSKEFSENNPADFEEEFSEHDAEKFSENGSDFSENGSDFSEDDQSDFSESGEEDDDGED